jgi:hypothetical protein
MSAELQTLAALLVVATTATWLVLRALAKRKTPGCGGCGSCPSTELKARLGPKPPAA